MFKLFPFTGYFTPHSCYFIFSKYEVYLPTKFQLNITEFPISMENIMKITVHGSNLQTSIIANISSLIYFLIKDNFTISSFDLRSSSGPGQHWKDDKTLGDRGYVLYEESPRICKSYLNLERLVPGDSGQYRCRVDYQVSPTRNTRIKLKLVGRIIISQQLT